MINMEIQINAEIGIDVPKEVAHKMEDFKNEFEESVRKRLQLRDGLDRVVINLKEPEPEEESKTYCMSENLFFTTMGRVTLDNHPGETFIIPGDHLLMTKEELKEGIKGQELLKRLKEVMGEY